MKQNNIEVKGKLVDNETRCEHYHSERDRIAIKFKCCNTYYSCIYCHEERTNHPVVRWEKIDFKQQAVLCGSCGIEISIDDYLHTPEHCPTCKLSFNPGCKNHHHFYFEIDS
ncbi:CHY zinc finger protein [Salipaludibacillus sp. HK11]|uniref:CHY zinc finger protein n=1 Tax=Salipaludibacillus sp. HK11 TaxID=3394320 RepID=UPI0039FBBF4A